MIYLDLLHKNVFCVKKNERFANLTISKYELFVPTNYCIKAFTFLILFKEILKNCFYY